MRLVRGVTRAISVPAEKRDPPTAETDKRG